MANIKLTPKCSFNTKLHLSESSIESNVSQPFILVERSGILLLEF